MTVPSTADAFPPHVLREYAFIADGERGGLVGPRGDIVWMCAPRWDTDGGLRRADRRRRGGYAVTPEDRYVWGGYYEPGSLIWRSRWVGSGASSSAARRSPSRATQNRVVMLRRIERAGRERRGSRSCSTSGPDSGAARLQALGQVSRRADRAGSGPARRPGTCAGSARWAGAPGRGQTRDRQRTGHELALPAWRAARPGARGVRTGRSGDQPASPAEAVAHHRAAWEHAVPACEGVTATRDASHACAVLARPDSSGRRHGRRGHDQPAGAGGGGRNYDYRYAWIRDQCYAGSRERRAREPTRCSTAPSDSSPSGSTRTAPS